MKYHYTFLALLLTACAGGNPAPVEIKGTKFYGKNNASTSEYLSSDSYNSDFVYKGKAGESLESKSYNGYEYSEPEPINKPSGYHKNTSIIKSTKLSAPAAIEDNIDANEYDGNIEVPNYSDENSFDVPKPARQKFMAQKNIQSDDYVAPMQLSSSKKATAMQDIEPASGNSRDYKKERIEKLKAVKPMPKPSSLTDESSEDELVSATPKEKPVKLEPKVEKEEGAEKPEKAEKVEKPEPKKEVVKKEAAKKEPLKEVIKEPASKEVEEKEEAFIKVPDVAPAIKESAAAVKADVVSVAEPKHQDIASIPKIAAMAPASGKFVKPVDGKIIKEFGGGSDGITIQAAEGTPVKAASSGEVVYSGNQLQGYGNMIVIKHPNGYLTAYSHLEDLPLKKGAKVGQGEIIGKVGKTGNVTSPQLHFGVRKGRSAVNPRDYL